MITNETGGRAVVQLPSLSKPVKVIEIQVKPSKLAVILWIANLITWIGMIAYGLITYGNEIRLFLSQF